MNPKQINGLLAFRPVTFGSVTGGSGTENIHRLLAALLIVPCLLLGGCASLQKRDPLQVTVAGIEPLQGEGTEVRLNVKLRVQNPNDAPIEYMGVSLAMDVQGNTFASGVCDASGTVPRFGEVVIDVPVTISAFRMVRQAIGMLTAAPTSKIQYEMSGKLAGGTFSATRFKTKGEFDMPSASSVSL